MNSSLYRLCRLCLKFSENSSSLFECKNDNVIADLIEEICQIEIHEDETETPQKLCEECLEVLMKVVSLRLTCRATDKFLREGCLEASIEDQELSCKVAKDTKFIEEHLRDDVIIIEALDDAELSSPGGCVSAPTVYLHAQLQTKPDIRSHGHKNLKNKKTYKTKTQRSDLRSLYEELEQTETLSCCFCLYTDVEDDSLNEHLQSHADYVATGKMYCLQCPLLITTMETLIDHNTNHNQKIKTHRCLSCKKTFAFNDKFVSHLRRCKKQSNKNACFCPQCGREFLRLCLLKDHVKFIHEKEVAFTCTICDQGFGSKSALNGHMKRHIENNKYNCMFCSKKFSSHNLLASHQLVHLTDQQMAVSCPKCDKLLKHQKLLKNHLRSHEVNLSPKYLCGVCGKALNSSFGLSRHLLTHSGEKPHKCTFCSKSYAQKSDLNKHLRTHLGENTYSCNHQTCQDTFRVLSDLRLHETTHFRKEQL